MTHPTEKEITAALSLARFERQQRAMSDIEANQMERSRIGSAELAV